MNTVTKQEAAEILERHESAITRYISAGKLTPVGRRGRFVELDRAEVDRLKVELDGGGGLLSTEQAAERLGNGRDSAYIRGAAQKGWIKAVKRGRKIFIPAAEIDQLKSMLESGSVQRGGAGRGQGRKPGPIQYSRLYLPTDRETVKAIERALSAQKRLEVLEVAAGLTGGEEQ